MARKTIVIGGGIAGLAAAYALHQSACDLTLLESAPKLGGKITSVQEDGFLVESGPDSFLAQKPIMRELCQRIGLAGQLVGSSSGADATTYVWRQGRLRAVPEGMMLMAPTMLAPFLQSSLISWPGKLRMGLELFVPPRRDDADESLADFVRRRLGSEALERFAGPLMAGIHAADPERLSLASTFPMFREMERSHGSLLRAMLKRGKQRAAHSRSLSAFLTLRGGLQQLTAAIADQLPVHSIRTGTLVASARRFGGAYQVRLDDGSILLADDVIFATPAYVTAGLLETIDPLLASHLRSIRYVSTATVSLAYRRSAIRHPMRGSGFIVPFAERRRITACSWSSQKFPHRAPEDSVLLRVFIGGALAEHLAEQDEASLIQLAREELRITMDIDATPVLAKACRWRKASPQYEVGHRQRLCEIERSLAHHPGLHLAGAAYYGAGIPDCIAGAMHVARAIVTQRAHANQPYHDLHPVEA